MGDCVKKDITINKEKQNGPCKVLDTSSFSMIKYIHDIHDEGNLTVTE